MDQKFRAINTSYSGVGKNLVILGLLVLLGINYWETKSKKDKVLAIYVGENETRLIESKDDPVLKKEMVNFINTFVDNYYTYSNKTISDRMRVATDLMSESYFVKNKAKFQSSIEKVEARSYVQQSRVRRVVRKENGEYQVDIEIRGKSKMSKFGGKYQLDLVVNRVDRNTRNSWGLEVAYVKENRI